MLLSLKLRTGSLDTRLRSRLAAAIREGLSAWHVPTHMLQVDDTPYMVNGKKMDMESVLSLINHLRPLTTSIAETLPPLVYL